MASLCCVKKVICRNWTGLSAGSLANNADSDQMPQNAASDQGLHCLLKLKEGLNETVMSPHSGAFSIQQSESIDPLVLSVL